MAEQHRELLGQLCLIVHRAQELAEQEHRRERFGDTFTELLIKRVDEIKIEIRLEHVSHHEPHMHISHSDKFDVSLSLNDFRVLAGEIDRKTWRRIKPVLEQCQPHLMDIWNALNVEGDGVKAQRLISNLP